MHLFMQKEEKRMKKKVKFIKANALTANELKAMGDDGYEFVIENGKITGVLVPVIQ